MLDHTGRTFTLLGDSDRVRCHSRFHPAIRLAGRLTSKANEKKVTLPPAQRAYGPEGTVNSEPVNGYLVPERKPRSGTILDFGLRILD